MGDRGMRRFTNEDCEADGRAIGSRRDLVRKCDVLHPDWSVAEQRTDTQVGHGGLSHVWVGVMKNLKGPRAQ